MRVSVAEPKSDLSCPVKEQQDEENFADVGELLT